MVIGVTVQEAAISAMMNARESHMRCALSTRAGVMVGSRPPKPPTFFPALLPGSPRALPPWPSHGARGAREDLDQPTHNSEQHDRSTHRQRRLTVPNRLTTFGLFSTASVW